MHFEGAGYEKQLIVIYLWQKPSLAVSALMDRAVRRGRDSVGPRHSNFCGTFVRVEKVCYLPNSRICCITC